MMNQNEDDHDKDDDDNGGMEPALIAEKAMSIKVGELDDGSRATVVFATVAFSTCRELFGLNYCCARFPCDENFSLGVTIQPWH